MSISKKDNFAKNHRILMQKQITQEVHWEFLSQFIMQVIVSLALAAVGYQLQLFQNESTVS